MHAWSRVQHVRNNSVYTQLQTHTRVRAVDTHPEAISELGAFYQAAGPRARLSEATKTSVLRHLAAVDDALPAEEESLLGF
jgi:hypothetical protein